MAKSQSTGNKVWRALKDAERGAAVEKAMQDYEKALAAFKKSGDASDRMKALQAVRTVREKDRKFRPDASLL